MEGWFGVPTNASWEVRATWDVAPHLSVPAPSCYNVPGDDADGTAGGHPPNHDLMTTTTPSLNWIANYIWGIADDVLRDVYVRGKYRDVILPMTVLRRLDAVLEPTKEAVLDMKAWLDEQGIVEQKETLRQAAGQAFYTFLDFEETEESKIFENEEFGYWKVTVERPLRLAVDLSEERRDEFFDACIEMGEVALGEAVHDVGDKLGAGPHRDFNRFLEEVKAELARHGVKMIAKRKNLLRTVLADRDEAAEPVVKKAHRRGTVADPIQGLFEVGDGSRVGVVEYEPDTGLRDSEQIPLQQEGGIVGFLRREVLPYAPDAWYVPGSVKIGCEISFNRHFYKPEPMRTLEEIRADIVTVEQESAGLLQEIIGGGKN